MAKDKPQTDMTDLARQTQALFNLNGAAKPQFEQVTKVQEGMLEQAETFTRHWLERRQEALDTGLEALNEINSSDTPDPVAAMQTIAKWQRGSLERLTEDFREWMTVCLQPMQLAATPQSETKPADAASSGTDQGKAPSKPKGGAAASRAKSDHATPV